MRGLACLISLMLVPIASVAEPSIVGSWIVVHIDGSQDPELTGASICLTFGVDGTFELRGRQGTQRGGFVGRYSLNGNQLRLEIPGEDPVTEYVEVGQHRLRLVADGDDPDEDPGLILERTLWCE